MYEMIEGKYHLLHGVRSWRSPYSPHQVIFSFTHLFLSLVSGKLKIEYIYCLSFYSVSSLRAGATDLF